MSEQNPKHWRQVKSFVQRSGRITSSQNKAIIELHPKFGIKLEDGELNLSQIFGRSAKLVLEIGFGDGKNLIHMAQMQPKLDFIGVDVHLPGIGSVLAELENSNLSNVRIFKGDALDLLNCIASESLAQVCLFFPDPWPKKKHHKRRIVQSDFVKLIAQKMQIGGKFYLATDWQDYALQMLEVLSNEPCFTNCSKDFSARAAFRILTKFERRGQNLGHNVWDLCFIKI